MRYSANKLFCCGIQLKGSLYFPSYIKASSISYINFNSSIINTYSWILVFQDWYYHFSPTLHTYFLFLIFVLLIPPPLLHYFIPYIVWFSCFFVLSYLLFHYILLSFFYYSFFFSLSPIDFEMLLPFLIINICCSRFPVLFPNMTIYIDVLIISLQPVHYFLNRFRFLLTLSFPSLFRYTLHNQFVFLFLAISIKLLMLSHYPSILLSRLLIINCIFISSSSSLPSPTPFCATTILHHVSFFLSSLISTHGLRLPAVFPGMFHVL